MRPNVEGLEFRSLLSTLALQAASDSGASNRDGITSAQRLTFDVSGVVSGSTVQLIRKAAGAADSAYQAVASRGDNGPITDAGPLAEGSYVYSIVVTPIGSVSTSGPVAPPVAVTVDLTPPAVPAAPALAAGPNVLGSQTSDTAPTLFATGVEPSATVTLLRDGAAVASRVGAGNITDPGPVALGNRAYALQQVDLAGNAGPTGPTTTITIDTPRQLLEAKAVQEINADIAADANASPPHQGDPVEQAEHMAVMNLVPLAGANAIAILSGDWSNPDTWLGQQVPAAGSKVWIMPGRTVSVDGVLSAPIQTVRVSGTLRFDTDRNTQLRVDTMVVDTQGTFQMGTTDDRVRPDVTAKLLFTDFAPIDTTWDPGQYSRGLISHGAASIDGAVKTPYVALAALPNAGDTVVRFASSVSGWRVGDQVLLPGQIDNKVADETFRVTAIAADGKSVTLDHAVQGARQQVNQPGVSYYLADLTRNVVLASENPADVAGHGHTMFMHSDKVHVEYAEFDALGRTVYSNLLLRTVDTTRGRYAVHFHRTGDNPADPAIQVIGAVATGSPGWGFVNHSSHVDFFNNISYNDVASGFATESGDEAGSFQGNFIGPGSEVGLYLSGPAPAVQNNIIVGDTTGILYAGYPDYTTVPTTVLPGPTLVDPNAPAGMIRTRAVPLNVVGNKIAETTYAIYVQNKLASPDPSRPNLIADTVIWDTTRGFSFNYGDGATTIRNTQVYGGTSWRYGMDGFLADLSPSFFDLEGVTIEGFGRGINVSSWGDFIIHGGVLENQVDVVIPPQLSVQGGLGNAPRRVDIAGVYFGPIPVVLAADRQMVQLQTTSPWTNYQTVPDDKYGGVAALFQPDRIYLDGQQVYADSQAPSYVVSGTGVAAIDGLTNLQLMQRYDLANRGALTPPRAYRDPRVSGGMVGPAGAINLSVQALAVTTTAAGFVPTFNIYSRGVLTSTVAGPAVNLAAGWNLVPVYANGKLLRYALVKLTS